MDKWHKNHERNHSWGWYESGLSQRTYKPFLLFYANIIGIEPVAFPSATLMIPGAHNALV